MEVTWKVEDGYVGHGPLTTDIPDDELIECETDEDRKQLIYDYIQQDFENKVSWACEDLDRDMEEWKDEQEEANGEDNESE